MQTFTLTAQSLQELETKLHACQTDHFQPNLALIFSSIERNLNELCELFDRHDIELFGCTSAGEILNDEVYSTSIVGILFQLDPDAFQVYFSADAGKNTYQKALDSGKVANDLFQNPALIVASGGVTNNADDIIDGLKEALGREVPIFGGLAGDDLNLSQTFVFSRKGVSDNGIISLILNNSKIAVTGMAISGWEAIGVTHTITKAEDNIVYTIDDEPALDVFIKYFGYFDDADLQGRPISTISSQYPLQIMREDGSTVLRSPLIGDENNKTLTLAGGIKQGDRFRFSISPGFQVVDETVKAFSEFKEIAPEADALILFSCKGRHAALGPIIEDEIKGIYNHWQAPMIGFFSYGEIGATPNGTCAFHNETCSLVLLKYQ